VPSTFQAVLALALAILPGALYTWAFEQRAGRWGATATDRIQRFLGASAILLVLALPLLYEFYRKFVVSGRVRRGEPLPWWVWVAALAIVMLPIVAGQIAGRAAHNRRDWVEVLTGPTPAPRAWDSLFAAPDITGWLLLRLKDGSWVGGLWGESERTGLKSYAAGYPETQDLLISDLAEMDTEGEMFVDENGDPVLTGVSLLVRWDEVAYAKFVPG
jgi:hypothetical protein